MENTERIDQMEDMVIDEKDLVENPTTRVPICQVLDVSSSMEGEPINELNKGVKTFIDAVKNDEVARQSAEISIVTFGTVAKLMLDFRDVTKQEIPHLIANGSTPMGEAVNLALDILEKRKREYSNAGVDYYQPWMILMTDGAPTDSIEDAVQRTCDLIEMKKLTIFPVGIGPHAQLDVLGRFSPKRKPLRLKGLNFKEFFEWLSKSVSQTSRTAALDSHKAPGWAETD